MRKIYMLAISALMALGINARANEVVEPYSYAFDEAITVSATVNTLPMGWNHLVNGYSRGRSTTYQTYTYKTDGGVEGTGALQGDKDQNNIYSSSYDDDIVYDLVVTPVLEGTVTLDVKLTDATVGGVQFYKVNVSGVTLTRGDEIEVNAADLSTEAFTTVSFTLDEATCVGIRINKAIIDNLTASKATIVPKRILSITASNLTVGGTDPMCDENNHFTAAFKATLKNEGEATILATDEDATLSIAWNTSYKSDGTGYTVLYTAPIGQDIAVGETVTVEISTDVDATALPSRPTYGLFENVSGHFNGSFWIEPKLYVPELRFRDTNGSLVSAAQNYGRTTENISKTYRVCNSGAAPLVVTNITVPEGFVVDKNAFTVASNEYEEITVTLDASTPVIANGNLVLEMEGLDDFTLPFSGIVLDASKYFESMSASTWPLGMVHGPNWSLKWVTSMKDGNKYFAEYGRYRGEDEERDVTDLLVTPLLSFGENEQFSFDITRISTSYSNYLGVDVYYSTDRLNWTLAESVSLTADEKSTTEYYGKAVSIPAGNYYIGFAGSYCRLSNLYGGQIVEVAHDMLLSQNAKTNAMVNKEYTATGSVENLKDQAENVTIALVVDGETVATKEVEVAAAGKASYELSFMPGEAADVTAKFVLTTGDYTAESAEWNVAIAEETFNTSVLTPYEGVSMSASQFNQSNYKHSYNNTIYTAEYIPVAAGTAITSLTFYGYCTSDAIPEQTVNVYVASTELDAATQVYPTLSEMTHVVADSKITIPMVGSSSDMQPLYTLTFDEPYVYEGGNLMVYTQFDADTYRSGAYIAMITDDAAKNKNAHYHVDSTTVPSTLSTLTPLPVTGFGIEAEPATVSGKLLSYDEKTGTSTPLAGATITLTAVDEPAAEGAPRRIQANTNVTYTGISDENGEYSIPVLQADKKYTMTVSAPGHVDYTHDTVIDPTAGDVTVPEIPMAKDAESGISTIMMGARQGIFTVNGVQVSTDADTTKLPAGIYIVNGRKVVVTRK